MKEAIVSKGPTVKIVDSPIPEPNEDQVLIRVVVSGSNPKDWKLPEFSGVDRNEGDDIAGVVVKVGSRVSEFKSGDRVAAFHQMVTPHGSYAEYAIAWEHTTFHIPAATPFEEAATLPLAAMTAAIGLFLDQRLPQPWTPPAPDAAPIPLIIYGAGSAVGSFATQLAARAGIHPILAVAGSSAPWVETLIDRSKGDTIVDYREGDAVVVAGLKAALGDLKAYHAFDAVAEGSTALNISRVLEPTGTYNGVLGWKGHPEIPETFKHVATGVGRVHKDAKDFGAVYFRYLGRGLQDGWLKPHPHEVVPGGLAGVETALKNLKAGKAHAVKYVFRIAETEGAGRDSL